MSEASWRSGYAEDCKSLHPGSIPGEASNGPQTVLLLRTLSYKTCSSRKIDGCLCLRLLAALVKARLMRGFGSARCEGILLCANS